MLCHRMIEPSWSCWRSTRGSKRRSFSRTCCPRTRSDEQTAMITWLGLFAHELFGEDPTFKLDRVTFRGKNAAHSQIMVGAETASRFYEFDWIYEWGDWRIDTLSCARGCE